MPPMNPEIELEILNIAFHCATAVIHTNHVTLNIFYHSNAHFSIFHRQMPRNSSFRMTDFIFHLT